MSTVLDAKSENLHTQKRPTASLAQRLRDELEEDVVQGRLAPGTKLDEQALAERFGVSRTPIREALAHLVSVGLCMRAPRRGVVVAEIAFDTLLEMFEVMAELEGLAGRLAARRLTDTDAAAIQHAHDECRQAAAANARDDYYYANERFHRAIQEASHSGFLIEQCAILSRRLKPYRRMQLDARNRIATSFAEHEQIVDAILGMRPEDAQKRLAEHVLIQNERFRDLISAMARMPGQKSI
jgi:DNA-binding GntR family transcriptional regulator